MALNYKSALLVRFCLILCEPTGTKLEPFGK